ncbi:MAG: beta-Ala-His dipeptidase [Erysipelotrichaceae bacterium]|nr:beta-Ala-His dipeptidase [Erysipelotrichaceae bacterium]
MTEFDLSRPQNYWFNEIAKIPHPSRHEKKLSDFIVEFAKERGLNYKQDEVFNVIVEKPASKGYENAAPLILQAHIDMVPAKVEGSTHDFENDPLQLYVDEEGWLHAKDTTLGGDDGHGVAYMLSILDDDELPHPALQCFFTTMEEIGLLGSMELKSEDVHADRMINLDGGGETSTGISAAGGCNVFIHKDIVWQDSDKETYSLDISGLSGGHSGGQIHLEKGNAIVIAARVIEEAIAKGMDFELVSFTGGEKDNAIPRLANIVFNSACDFEMIKTFFAESEKNIKTELEFSDPQVCVTVTKADKAGKAIAGGRDIVDYAYLMPNGFQHRSMVIEGLTLTSLNLGVAITNDKEIYFDTLIRSAMDHATDDLKDRMHLLADKLGLRYELTGRYSGWNYEPKSEMREKLRKVVRDFGNELQEFAGHGGNECGVFKALNPKLDIITFGPKGSGIHTPDEKLDLDSFERSYQMLKQLVAMCD